MKKIMISILCLALASMACLSTAAAGSLDVSGEVNPAPASPMASATMDEVPQNVTTTLIPDERCAVVIASEALHLRELASESARVLTWLKRGDVVQVVSIANVQWTHVRFEGFEGFARSVYLENVECVK